MILSKKLSFIDLFAGGIVNPHFMRGYFKRLESDFYKNKKGQIIFLHETVVNTQAKTLE